MPDHGIAGEAHDLVYGERAKTYGHPRTDFSIIASIWTGLLKDKLKDGELLDPYRVSVMMTGLKLARLVQSPGHKDSRVDTIGYMLTMERLDEPAEEFKDAGEGMNALANGDPILLDMERRHPWDDNKVYTFAYADPFAYADDGTLISGNSEEKEIWARSYPEAVKAMQNWEAEQAERELDKHLGRETSEHSQQLDAEEDDQFKVLVDGELAVVVSGLVSAGAIEWQEGDRLETLGDDMGVKTSWMYAKGSDTWFRSDNFSFSGRDVSFRELRSNYSPLKVTSGAYKGLLLLKDGVGYIAER